MYGFYLCLRKAQLIFLAAGARFTDVEFCLETLYTVTAVRILLLSVTNRHISNWGSYPASPFCYQIYSKGKQPKIKMRKTTFSVSPCRLPFVIYLWIFVQTIKHLLFSKCQQIVRLKKKVKLENFFCSNIVDTNSISFELEIRFYSNNSLLACLLNLFM